MNIKIATKIISNKIVGLKDDLKEDLKTKVEALVHPKAEDDDIAKASEKLEKELALGSKLSIIRLVDCLVECAQEMRSSDIHIDPEDGLVRVRFRIDGVLQDLYTLPKTIHGEVVSRIKILSGLRTDEHQTAQDGRFRVTLPGNKNVDVRVSVIPSYHGENAVLRLLSDKAEEYSLKSLGFSEPNQRKIIAAIKKPYGMVLATGPTGSGKTTTLYTLVKMLPLKTRLSIPFPASSKSRSMTGRV